MTESDLFRPAVAAMHNAYAPYTGVKVGVALKLSDGRVVSGSNVENVAYYGFDSIETAVSSLVSSSDWTQNGTLPAITDALFVFNKVNADEDSYLPGPQGLFLLRLFGTPDTRLSFATEDKGVIASRTCHDLIARLPVYGVDRKKFLEQAVARRHTDAAIPKKLAKNDNLRRLYETRRRAFCPVSDYAVGAQIETLDGEFFYGCNVELGGNKGLHAEACAIANMVTARGPNTRIKHVTIITAGRPGAPCGGCRQHILEFSTPRTVITGYSTDGKKTKASLKKLLPRYFGPRDLESGEGAE